MKHTLKNAAAVLKLWPDSPQDPLSPEVFRQTKA